MEEMFRAIKHLSGDWGIQRWNTTNIKSLEAIFMSTAWTEPYLDLSQWDVSNVQIMDQLFRWSNVSVPNISSWDVGGVIYMGWMFEGASSFNHDLSVAKVLARPLRAS